MNPNLAEVGKPTRWPPDQSGNPAGIERSILACRETGHSPVGRIDRAGGPLVVAIAEACNTRPVAAPLRAADAALFVILRAVLGCHHLPGCDWPWHFDRRLADRTDRRIQNYPIDAGAGLLRFGGWRHHALRGDIFGHSSVYHTHRNRFDHSGRSGAKSIRRSLEHRRQHCRRLDRHIASLRHRGRAMLLRGWAL